MEENKKIQVNKLEKEGRIDSEDIKKSSKERQEDMTTDSIEQIIDLDTVIEAANQNNIYANMLEPCALEGINITKRLRKYFEENKVKPEDLVEEIRRQMSVIRKDINQHTQNLFFDESGNINIELSIEKARRNGAKLPNYIKNIDEEIPREATEEEKREPFLVNGVDVSKQIEDKSEEFWENFQKDIEERFKKLDEEHNIEEAVSKIDEQKSDKNKEFKVKILSINNLLRSFLKFKNEEQRKENLLKMIYLYQEYKQLDLGEVEGLSEETRHEIAESIKGLEEIIKYSSSEVFALDIENANLDDVIKSFRYSEEKEKEISKEFQNEFAQEIVKQAGNDKSYSELNKENKAESEKRDLIRVIKLYKTFEEISPTVGTIEKVKQFYPALNPESFNIRMKKIIDRNYPGLMAEAEKEYDQDNLMPIYAEIFKRNYLLKSFSNFRKTEDVSDKENLLKEYTTIINAIDFICREDVYENSGEKFQEDIDCNNQAIKVLKEVFPEVVVRDSKINMQKLLVKFKERYSFDKKVEKINDIASLFEYIEIRANFKMRGVISENFSSKSGDLQSITELLGDKEVLKEVQKKNEIQENLVIKEKKFSILERKLETLLQNGKNLSPQEENDLVKYLCIVVKEYAEETDLTKYLLYDIAKTNLSRFLPGVFDKNNIFHSEKIDEEFKKYMQDQERPIDNPAEFLKKASEEINDVAKKQYLKDDLKRDPKALAEKESKSNMKRMTVFSQAQKQEKLLKFVAFVRRAGDTGKINLDNTNDSLNLIEGKVKENLEALFANRENPKKEVEDYLEKIKLGSTDDDFVESMIRNVRRRHANSIQSTMLKKYKKEDRITDEDDIKKILTAYLGTKNDTRNSIINVEKNNLRHKSFSVFLRKISPELVQKTVINEEAILKFYNQIYHTDFSDIEDVYSIEENKLLENVVQEVATDVSESKKRYYDPRTMAGIITSDELEIHNNLQAGAFKEREEQINNTVDLMGNIQKLLVKDLKEGLSLEESTQLLKNTVSVIALLNEETKKDPRFESSQFEMKYSKFKEKSMEMLESSLQKFSLGSKQKNGSFDLELLSKKCEEYFESEGITIDKKDGQSTVEAILDEFYFRKATTLGPSVPKAMLEQSMKKRIDGMDSAIREWKEFKIKDDEMLDMSWEEIETSSLDTHEFTEESRNPGSDEKEFAEPTEEIPNITVEEITVAPQNVPSQEVPLQDDLNIDNHPAVIEKSNLFTRAFKKLGKLIKESIDNFKNGHSSNDNKTPDVVPIKTIDSEEEIRRLTGYGRQEIDFSVVNSAKTGGQLKTSTVKKEALNGEHEVGDE